MPGLSAKQLPPEVLRSGDLIEYYSRRFVLGDPRGLRVAVVLAIDDKPDVPLPVKLDTKEALPLDNLLRRRRDSSGKKLDVEKEVKWRKLRSYKLEAGKIRRPTHASTIGERLSAAVDAAMADVREILREQNEGISSSHPVGVQESPTHLGGGIFENACSSTLTTGSRPDETRAKDLTSVTEDEVYADFGMQEGEYVRVARNHSTGTLNQEKASRSPTASTATSLTGDSELENPQEHHPNEGVSEPPTDAELLEAQTYVDAVPTRWMREKIRHKAKKRAVGWATPRSRKKRYQAKCGVTRSGSQIYHAHSLKAKRVKALLRLPGVITRLKHLRERRPVYTVPAATTADHLRIEVPWPSEVRNIRECMNPSGIIFKDVGDLGVCSCFGDCFMNTCTNSVAAVYCTPDNCRLGAVCSNTPRSLDTLKLFDTGRVGLGVFTTTDLDVGDVVGEYAGVLSEYDAVVEGLPSPTLKYNSGYTLLYNTKSATNKYVYVEAKTCGFITRFISHSCKPNAAFVELQNRTSVKVVVRMIQDVKAGAQITVNYGNQTWFKCACDECWSGQAE